MVLIADAGSRYASPMKPPIDSTLRDLFQGDSIYTTTGYSKLISITEALAKEGYMYEITRLRGGRLVLCTQSPLKTPQDGYDRAMQS